MVTESSETTSNSHLNFYPGGYQIKMKKSSKANKAISSSTKLENKTRSCATRNCETNVTIRRKFSTSSSKTSTSTDNKKGLSENYEKKPKSAKKSSSTTSTDEELPLKLESNHKKPLGCSCETCIFWDKTDGKHDQKEKFADADHVKVVKNIVKPPLLLKLGTENKVEVKTLSTLPNSIALKGKNVQLPPLVVHGYFIK